MDRIRCTECGKDAFKWTTFNSWLRLIHVIDFLYLNDDISKDLHDSLFDNLMHFKLFAAETELKHDEGRQEEIKILEEIQAELEEIKGPDNLIRKLSVLICSMKSVL